MYRLFWRIAIRPSIGKVALLVWLILAGALIEVLRVVLIVPMVALLLETSDVAPDALLRTFRGITESLGLGTDRRFLLTLIGVLLLASVLLEKGTTLLLTVVTARTKGSIRVTLLAGMFDAYMRARYHETMRRGMAGVWQDLGAGGAVSSLVGTAANAMSSLMLLLAMGSLMMVMSWQASLLAIGVLIPITVLLSPNPPKDVLGDSP